MSASRMQYNVDIIYIFNGSHDLTSPNHKVAAQSGGLGGLVRHRSILTGQKKSGQFY